MLDEREPFTLEGLERYKIENGLLEKALQGRDIRLEFERLRASGAIPPGTPGECWFEETRGAIEELAEKVRDLRQGDALAPVTVDLAISDFRICGPVSGLYPGGLIRHRLPGKRPAPGRALGNPPRPGLHELRVRFSPPPAFGNVHGQIRLHF